MGWIQQVVELAPEAREVNDGYDQRENGDAACEKVKVEGLVQQYWDKKRWREKRVKACDRRNHHMVFL